MECLRKALIIKWNNAGFRMTQLTRLLCLVMCLSALGHISGQSNITINHKTKDYGEHYRWVYDITQDDYGFIWFANHTGLRRYDGEDFVTFQNIKGDSTSLSTNTIIRITKDYDSNIWAFAEDGIFNKLNLSTGLVIRVDNPFTGKNPTTELRDFGALSNGNITLLYHTKEIYSLWKYNPDKNAFDHIIDVPTQNTTINHFTERSDGKLWLWALGKGYYLVDVSNKVFEHYPLEDIQNQSIAPIDSKRKFWYPSDLVTKTIGGELKSFEIPDDIDISKIERISVDNLGNIWFYHGEADLYHFDIRTETLEKLVSPIFKKSEGIQLMYHFFEDKDGGYWNGHFFGAIRFTKNQKLFSTYFDQENGTDQINTFSARDIIEISPNQLLVKENEQKLYTVDLVTQETKPFELKYSSQAGQENSKTFYSMALSQEGHLWRNEADKLIKTNLQTGDVTVFTVPKSRLASSFNDDELKKYWPRIFIDANNNLWWCDPEGLRIFNISTNKLESIQVNPTPSSVNSDFKYAQYDPVNDVIYGSYNQGIYVVNCKNRSVELHELYSINEGYDILITSFLNWKNEFWLSTNKGLIRYTPETQNRTIYNRKNGLPSSVVYSALGSQQHLWLATHNGLSQFDPYRDQIVNYDLEQGLPFNKFNIWSSIKSSDGKLFFGGQNGIIGINPEEFVIKNDNKGELNLVEISKYNEGKDRATVLSNLPYTVPDALTVKANERNLSFKFTHALYDNFLTSQYSHYMEGLEENWIEDGTRNEIRYTQIPPGNYTFRVRATASNNISALNEIAIPIIVEQYWYFKWWSIVIYILIGGSLIYFLYSKQLERKLAKAESIRLKKWDEVKTKMYTNITHEFRTPLTVMLGMNEAIRGHANDGEIEKVFHANEMIDRNGKNLLELVNQMLELSKLEAGVVEINNQYANIVDYLRYRMESFQSYGESKNIQIDFKANDDPILMDFDVDKISYIIGNLVSNAIKYTPEKGNIVVEVSKKSSHNSQYDLELKVKDNGIGMEAEKIDRIFDRFYQIDDSNVRKAEGTGIGLSLVKELVKLLNGSIQVKSKIGEGTEFTVFLPITASAEVTTNKGLLKSSNEWSKNFSQQSISQTSSPKSNLIKPLVLVVEDNSDVSHYIGVSISDDYRVIYAANGKEGIEKAIELIPDIIISDVMMPKKDGFELCETLKTDERTSHIPIILLTGRADVDSKIQGLEHGADIYLSKPFHRKELLIRLKNLMTLRAEIQKHYSETDINQPISGLAKTENAFLVKLRSIILDNIDDDEFGVSQLCKSIHLSRSQLHRKLIALTGESTSTLIRKVQLHRAKELLDLGEYNVSEVAYMVGFKTPAHFSRVFSETFGEPPSSYLNK